MINFVIMNYLMTNAYFNYFDANFLRNLYLSQIQYKNLFFKNVNFLRLTK